LRVKYLGLSNLDHVGLNPQKNFFIAGDELVN